MPRRVSRLTTHLLHARHPGVGAGMPLGCRWQRTQKCPRSEALPTHSLLRGRVPQEVGSSLENSKAPGSVKARPQRPGRTSVLMELKPRPLVPRLRPQPSESGGDAGCLSGRPRAASLQHCCRLGKAVNLRVPPYLWGNTRKN